MSFAEVVNNLEYGIEFGILGGLVTTKGIDIHEIINFSEIEMKALFHPKHSKRIRRLCLETIVHGKVSEGMLAIARDLADIISIVRHIGISQWNDDITKAMLINNLEAAFLRRTDVGGRYFDLAIKMFSNKELSICLTNSHNVIDLLKTQRNNVEALCKAIDDNYDKLECVGYYAVDDKVNPSTDWVIRSIGYLAVCILTGDKANPPTMASTIARLSRITRDRRWDKPDDRQHVFNTLRKLEDEFHKRYPGDYRV